MVINFSSNAALLFSLACVTIMVATHAEIKLKWAIDAATALMALPGSSSEIELGLEEEKEDRLVHILRTNSLV